MRWFYGGLVLLGFAGDLVHARFVKVIHNGVVIHETVEVKGPTTAALGGPERRRGPLLLQGDHGPVAFRNLRLRHLTAGEAIEKDVPAIPMEQIPTLPAKMVKEQIPTLPAKIMRERIPTLPAKVVKEQIPTLPAKIVPEEIPTLPVKQRR